MTTEMSERGLERLICTALTGHPYAPAAAEGLRERPAAYGGWSADRVQGTGSDWRRSGARSSEGGEDRGAALWSVGGVAVGWGPIVNVTAYGSEKESLDGSTQTV